MDCLPSAFAEVSGLRKEDVIACIGHDGRKELWPELKPPFCYASFHLEELFIAMWKLGFTCATYVPKHIYLPHQLHQHDGHVDHLVQALVLDLSDGFTDVVKSSPGVMVGSWPGAELFHAIPCLYGYYIEHKTPKGEYQTHETPFICQGFVKVVKH